MQCIIVSTPGTSNLLDLAIFHAQSYRITSALIVLLHNDREVIALIVKEELEGIE